MQQHPSSSGTRPRRRAVPIVALGLLSLFAGTLAHAAATTPSQRLAGPTSATTGVLPDNRLVAPAGSTIATGTLPLGVLLLPDGRHLLLTEDGANQNRVENVDLSTRRIVQSLPVGGELFLSLVYDSATRTVYASGGGSHAIYRYAVDGQGLLRPGTPLTSSNGFWAGLAYLPMQKRLLAVDNLGNQLTVFDDRAAQGAVSVGDHPLAVAVSPDERRAYVADSGTNEISVLRLAPGQAPSALQSIKAGRYPTALVLSHDGKTLYVANANDDTISVIDTGAGRLLRSISIRPAGAPPGSAPDSLALSPDETTLYVACGGNNDVAVVRVADGTVRGLIPTGWWPSALTVAPDGRTLYVASAKGVGFGPNPGYSPYGASAPGQVVGSDMHGALSTIPVPDDATLARLTAQVRAQARVATLQSGPIAGNPIPSTPGGSTPFRHVIVIDKENRSYDQVFGDEPRGNGDANLTLFGRKVTPNLHALAERYGLLDNTYADGEVSADGHQWLDGAYATTYLQQVWPERYGRLGARPLDYGIAPISFPPSGYIFNDAAAHNVSFRVYGEQFNAGPFQLIYIGHADFSYPGFILTTPDQQRADEWLREFKGFVHDNNLPQLEYVWLPRDHTTGTLLGQDAAISQVADNDLAVGRLVDAVSHSRYWKDTLILCIEDDAQNGPDHVDGHRTEALAISAYNKTGAVIHTHYDQLSILRTLELVLNLPPLSQFDARALPMYDVFRDGGSPTAAPFSVLAATTPLHLKNTASTPYAALSAHLNFSTPDRVPPDVLNRILWASVRGAHAAYPTLGAPHTIVLPGEE